MAKRKARTHSSYANSSWLRDAHPQMAWVNVSDAKQRGIKDQDHIRVYNDRGTIEIIDGEYQGAHFRITMPINTADGLGSAARLEAKAQAHAA